MAKGESLATSFRSWSSAWCACWLFPTRRNLPVGTTVLASRDDRAVPSSASRVHLAIDPILEDRVGLRHVWLVFYHARAEFPPKAAFRGHRVRRAKLFSSINHRRVPRRSPGKDTFYDRCGSRKSASRLVASPSAHVRVENRVREVLMNKLVRVKPMLLSMVWPIIGLSRFEQLMPTVGCLTTHLTQQFISFG